MNNMLSNKLYEADELLSRYKEGIAGEPVVLWFVFELERVSGFYYIWLGYLMSNSVLL